jgi:Kef-type K+ transport system membrane component KefB
MELHQFFLYLAIILIAARLFSEVAGRYGIPPVIGELLAGRIIDHYHQRAVTSGRQRSPAGH